VFLKHGCPAEESKGLLRSITGGLPELEQVLRGFIPDIPRDVAEALIAGVRARARACVCVCVCLDAVCVCQVCVLVCARARV